MADLEKGVRKSAMSPKYLHTNSTSHTWPFSAIAELIDNAYDPDVAAKTLWIDVQFEKQELCLTFTDDGNGMKEEKLHKMLSFGFCEKVEINGHKPVGHYGNGFKSGSMRLGKDAIVFSKKDKTLSVGFLSQTYLCAINAETIMVPIVMWHSITHERQMTADSDASLAAIVKYSLFRSEADLLGEFDNINGPQGTRIIISKLRTDSTGNSEFDFKTDKYDILIPDDNVSTSNVGSYNGKSKYKKPDRQDDVPECDYSLRAYCSILYLRPKMRIIIRGKKVRTRLIAKSLRQTETDVYKPQLDSNAKPVKITIGFNTKKNHYGVMMYHRNRLIKAYERVGHQTKANEMGVGVVGIIECNYLQPTHNKQDFDYTKQYRACMKALGSKVNDYWNEMNGLKRQSAGTAAQASQGPVAESNLPDQTWVQCDRCLKWRKLADIHDPEILPDKWYCNMNTDPTFSSCSVDEEPEDSDDEDLRPSYDKTVKKQMEREKMEKCMRREEEKRQQKLEQERKIQEMERKLKRTQAQLQIKEREAQHKSRQLQAVVAGKVVVQNGVALRNDTPVYRQNMELNTQRLLTQIEEQRIEMERQQEQILSRHQQVPQVVQPGPANHPGTVSQPRPVNQPGTLNQPSTSRAADLKNILKRSSLSSLIAPLKKVKTDPDIIVLDNDTEPAVKRKCTNVNCTQTDPVEILTRVPDGNLTRLSALEQQQVLLQRTRELSELRRNVSQLLQVLVPELNLRDNDIDVDSSEIDELLKQVLQANTQS
ncbi:MORC family CW-type zinc finger protein 3-like [Ptychodera flava]|uniref:MORC family CW-type zinc finger protein 3-like n=1 Tax=Ptychodera flava TaxID=63121 RepID=UPI00396A3759